MQNLELIHNVNKETMFIKWITLQDITNKKINVETGLFLPDHGRITCSPTWYYFGIEKCGKRNWKNNDAEPLVRPARLNCTQKRTDVDSCSANDSTRFGSTFSIDLR